MIQRTLTAAEFSERRWELPDGGQWAELIRGVPVSLAPPDLEHGTIVLNLSKVFASYVHRTFHGYACFDLGLKVEHAPDTVFHPAACYYTRGERFAEADKDYSEVPPTLVVEILSTSERRRQVNERVTAYTRWGVDIVWLIDPINQTLHQIRRLQLNPERYGAEETITGGEWLPKFEMQIGGLFAEPGWV